jgi:hypothetical protein
MSQFPHDQFAKDLLESLLSLIGQAQSDYKISSEVREIDVCFFPDPQATPQPSLGLLQQLAATAAVFEPFRNPVTANEIRSCMSKLYDLHAELNRQAKKEGQPKPSESELPQLWILTPTLAAATLEKFGAITDVETWGNGVYVLASALKTGIVVLHQLPETPDTLWLRLLGKDGVQTRAIRELDRLPQNSPYRANVVELLSALKRALETKGDRNNQETELLMSLRTSPDYLEYIEQITQKGIEQGIERGKLIAQQELVLKLLTRKVGNLSPEMRSQILNLSIDRLASLSEALLDFQSLVDLESWLSSSW